MKHTLRVLFAVFILSSMLLTACTAPKAAPADVPPTKMTFPSELPPTAVPPTAEPTTAKPTANPLGTADMPLIMALAPSATSQELQAGGDAVAAKLSEMTGYSIQTIVPTSYAALVETLGSGNAHIGWLPPLAYMLAKYKGYADGGLVVLRSDFDHYAFQYVAGTARKNPDGKPMFKSYYDPVTGKSTADAATALAQFAGKKPCWADPISASGYVIPAGVLAKAGIKTKTGAWVQGHSTVINAIYLSANGEICDFGATYVDARTTVVKAFPNVNDKVQIIYVSDLIIPNDNISFSAALPAEIRKKLTAAFLQLADTEEGRALLKNGGYDIGGLKVVDDTFYDDFRVYLEAAGYDYTSYK